MTHTSTLATLDRAEPAFTLSVSGGGTPTALITWPDSVPPLADIVESFANVGLRVAEHEEAGGGHRFTFCPTEPEWGEETAALLADALAAAARGRFELDIYAQLIGSARIAWTHIILVRAACRYLRQAGLMLAESSIVAILKRHPDFLRAWTALFEARFDPDRQGKPGGATSSLSPSALSEIINASVAVTSTLDEDQVLRALHSFLHATLRTNWFQLPAPRAVAFKIDPSKLSLASPVTPFREIFVHSPSVEGSHVRGGLIARGGLRWSDRPDDFRTEVLGLLKTQVVKNSPIVPVGAKGAFVVRGKKTTHDTVRAAYEEFVGALLDVTDNLVGGNTVRPARTVTYDGDDPYLVVAADKGTAAFSDVANAIAVDRGFWLGDAFASGGSAGYDHKAMGITARGAWCSVHRHLSELGINAASDPFTVIGIGDMSGDVFGNGMLLSRAIRLVGAFDHRHIFLDPDPDPEASFAERQRLAALPRSSWHDYRRSLISDGGGVWSRNAKTIPLSPQAQQRLGVSATQLSPSELIKAMLTAEVDLLWNGGIGTYIKASDETDSAAADPANDSVRVDAARLRCRAVGEGGNLGFTQRARVEFALAGGKINGDFIDNAAGVATSDREVNIKIALGAAVAAGSLSTHARDGILAAATSDVAADVLADADRQTLAISLAEAHSRFLISKHERLIENLEAAAGITRESEGLPTEAEFRARQLAGTGLVRPEIAILLAQSKNLVRRELAASVELDDPIFANTVVDYFPPAVRAAASREITDHQLARDIKSVTVTSELINRVGPGFVRRLEEQFGVTSGQIAVAYWVVREVFGIDELWAAFVDAEIPPHTRMTLLNAVQTLIEAETSWLLRHKRGVPASKLVAEFAPHVSELKGELPQLRGLLAPDLTTLRTLSHALAFAEAARQTGCRVGVVAQAFTELGRALGFDWLTEELTAAATPETDHWDALAATILTAALHDRWHDTVRRIMEQSRPDPSAVNAQAAVAKWLAGSRECERIGELVKEVRSTGRVTPARLCVLTAAFG
ncbi:NAD-glutamate dehydrogenase [Hoyosella sp. YIM 151337]|uniref:NAD-glutamate dehydrogenase n=1 Tax=Hoyosella sp. YIM 151337 TaxID=2992742 RepID=UPI002236B7C4|nr:NAD-glutamate dehydrogenase [Hoyosella sp. YIM 151337]MCW4355465.1 NAD-glutamate dehydrogenase [Hoyosella sp. YIM 151337]